MSRSPREVPDATYAAHAWIEVSDRLASAGGIDGAAAARHGVAIGVRACGQPWRAISGPRFGALPAKKCVEDVIPSGYQIPYSTDWAEEALTQLAHVLTKL